MINFKILLSSGLILVSSFAVAQESMPDQELINAQCPSATHFSDVTYESLRLKLENTLKEKNKSLIFLDFKGLQAQLDVLSNHLISEDQLTGEQAIAVLEKTIKHIDQLDQLILKSKEAAKLLKDNHVVPLATLTSLKSEADACTGSPSQYLEIFRTLSQLNKDLNEVLMISQNKIFAQKEKALALIRKIDVKSEVSAVSAQTISESFNFMQKHINTITSTFEFDSKRLTVASSNSSTP